MYLVGLKPGLVEHPGWLKLDLYYLSIYVQFQFNRTYQDGRLQRNSNTDQLPTREQLNLRPNTRKLRAEKPEDFVAGDSRSNEQPFLATLHVVFLREHNRIAKRLKEYLPSHLRTV